VSAAGVVAGTVAWARRQEQRLTLRERHNTDECCVPDTATSWRAPHSATSVGNARQVGRRPCRDASADSRPSASAGSGSCWSVAAEVSSARGCSWWS
jgi:hypothetical protein